MVNITEEMKTKRTQKIAELEAKIDKNILEAVDKGLSSCNFPCHKNTLGEQEFYEELRRKYERAGYEIRPTGVNGGIWQTEEIICW